MSELQLSVFRKAQEFFREYQQLPIEQKKKDMLKWLDGDGVILNMPIEQQSEYADYVTKKVCALGHEAAENFAEFYYPLPYFTDRNQANTSYSNTENSCVIGNAAKLILTMKNPVIIEKHLKIHKQCIKLAQRN